MRNEWNIGPDEALMRSVRMILSRKPTHNTYKFAIIRALADQSMSRGFGPAGSLVGPRRYQSIEFRQLAGQMLGYYWPITLSSRLRQSIDPAMEPGAMRLIREEAKQLGLNGGAHLYEYRRSHPIRYNSLISKCYEPDSSLARAIGLLHVVSHYKVEPRLFVVCGEELQLTPSSVEFLTRHSRAVNDLAITYWVQFTEQLTAAPKITKKIEGAAMGWTDENVRKKYSRFLRDFWGDACFYCARTSASAPTTIGYAVPLSYVLEDRIWNIVLTCSVCLAEKGERTPSDPFIAKLVARNVELLKLIELTKTGLGNRDLHELHHYRAGIAEHLRSLIAGCRADGFGTWQGP